MIIGSSIRIKNLALLAHLKPAIFKHVLTEEMETIKIEKTRTADLETSMIENGLAEDRKEARRFLVKIWKPEMVTPPACPCKHLGALMTYIVINICFAQAPWIWEIRERCVCISLCQVNCAQCLPCDWDLIRWARQKALSGSLVTCPIIQYMFGTTEIVKLGDKTDSRMHLRFEDWIS